MTFGASLLVKVLVVVVVVVVTVLPGEGDLVPRGEVTLRVSLEPGPVFVVTTLVTTFLPPTLRGGVLRVIVLVLMRLVSEGALSWEPSRISRLKVLVEETLERGVCLV